jgi:hypothetical protein
MLAHDSNGEAWSLRRGSVALQLELRLCASAIESARGYRTSYTARSIGHEENRTPNKRLRPCDMKSTECALPIVSSSEVSDERALRPRDKFGTLTIARKR